MKGGASASPTGQPQQSYANLVSHEFFHLWNVKRIRPDVLGPFDYTKENYTKLLWVAEGFTDYYAQLALRRAGLITEQDFLEDRAKDFSDLQDTPGRLEQSVEEASYDAWIKFYRQDENSVNSQVSYYDKGGILGLLLDLEIRKLSHGARTLDDVMRYLYAEFYKKSRNYSPTDFQRACELMAGAKLDSFFGRYVHGKEELDYESALNAAGLHLEAGASAATDRAFFGADLVGQNERLLVRSVRSGSPAYEQGLNAGDQIVAFDGIRATQEFVTARLAEKRPGDVVRLTVFRFDQLRTIELKLGQVPHGDFRIVSVAQPSEEQHHIHEAWLGTRP